jgi:cobalt-zinc-cadmium efflux system membrane fusion protein
VIGTLKRKSNVRVSLGWLAVAVVALLGFAFTGCKKTSDPAAEAPPAAQVIQSGDTGIVSVDKPEQFPLVAASGVDSTPELKVTGSVNPDISREVPIISLASGRVVDVKARLGDMVKKGQYILRVESPDVSNAYDVYRKAVSDEKLANKQLVRSKDLFEHGAISQSTLEQAENQEDDAKADLKAAEDQLHTLGLDKAKLSNTVDIFSPITGVIVAQNVTNAAPVGVAQAGSPTAFTVADLSVVWVVCDVYENDLSKIHLGQTVHITANSFPDKTIVGRVSDIGPVLDPTLRTGKVRVEVANPANMLRVGMFVTAMVEGSKTEHHAVVPANAVMHLHDRDWVFVPMRDKKFKRVEVVGGKMLDNGTKQEILSGIEDGQKVVSNAISLESEVEN